jgi:hypothetical protein
MRRRLTLTLAFAALLHAGLLVLAKHLPAGRTAAGRAAPIVVEVELETEPEHAPASEGPSSPEPSGHDRGVNARVGAAAVAPRTGAAVARPPEPPAGEPAPLEGAEPKGAEAPWSSPPWMVGPVLDTGIGASWRPAPRATGPLAPPPEEPPRKGGGGLSDALAEHDRALGLGSGGPVLAVARDAALSALVDESAATIYVDADSSGRVTTARVVSSTGDGAGWNEVARAIVKGLRGRTLKMPPDARGITVTVRLEVAVRLPSGARAGHPVSTGVSDGMFTLGFDVADAAGRPRRVVSGQILDERRL